MERNEIMDFMISKPNFFKRINFIAKLKKDSFEKETLSKYFGFLSCLERTCFYKNSITKNVLCARFDNANPEIIFKINDDIVYIKCDSDDIDIRIKRSSPFLKNMHICVDFEEYDYIEEYDRVLIQYIFRQIKNNIILLIKKYINEI